MCLVALYIDQMNDYHWYRKNDDGDWSHKMGPTAATTKDFSGLEIGPDLKGADTAPYLFCSYMCAPCDLEISSRRRQRSLAVDNPEFYDIQILARSGMFNPGWNPTEAEKASIAPLLESLTEVEDPNWPVKSGYTGFVDVNPTSTIFRVWDGVIQIGSKYYVDVGLEDYLIVRAIDRGFESEVPLPAISTPIPK